MCDIPYKLYCPEPAADTVILVQDATRSVLLVVGGAFHHAFLYMTSVALLSAVTAGVWGECSSESTGFIDLELPILAPI